MTITLNDTEVRVLGCLMEKSVTTPDQYPLTLNALVTACNQKSSRNPVTSLDPGEVGHALKALEEQHLVSTKDNFNGRAQRYAQRLCNTPFAERQFSAAELALLILLMLRGPQTPGELRSGSGRLHKFADNTEVMDVLNALSQREDGPFVVGLARRSGRQNAEFAHLFAGPIDVEAQAEEPVPVRAVSRREDRMLALEGRLEAVESELRAIKDALGID